MFGMFKKKGYALANYRFSIIAIVMTLLGISCIVLQRLQGEDKFMIKQLLGILLGLIVMVFVSLIDYHFICKFFVPLYLLNLGLMLLCKYVTYSMFPLMYGWQHYTARRWIKIGGNGKAGQGFEFMPSEITKLVLVIFIAKLFVILGKRVNTVFGLLVSAVLILIPIYLVFDQPDLSTSIVLVATFICMLFIAGLSYRIVIPALAVGIPLLVGLFWYVQQDYQILLNKWQRNRILSILHPEEYPELMYQQNYASSAISTGGMFGKMIVGNDGRRVAENIPVVESDFIFSAVAEEFGYVGCVFVILLFILFVILSFRIARRAKDRLGYLVASGIAITIALQAVVNIGVVISLLPNTGIPLPFMSMGLSSLITNMATIGLLLNVGLHDKDVEIDDRYELEEGLLNFEK